VRETPQQDDTIEMEDVGSKTFKGDFEVNDFSSDLECEKILVKKPDENEATLTLALAV